MLFLFDSNKTKCNLTHFLCHDHHLVPVLLVPESVPDDLCLESLSFTESSFKPIFFVSGFFSSIWLVFYVNAKSWDTGYRKRRRRTLKNIFLTSCRFCRKWTWLWFLLTFDWRENLSFSYFFQMNIWVTEGFSNSLSEELEVFSSLFDLIVKTHLSLSREPTP